MVLFIGPQNPANDVFDDFDDEQGHNLLGSLHLETDEEPVRRGASRANSVRFDVSALQGSSWAQNSRMSGDFGPTRPSSGFGSHPMTERSLSHKSNDGRHSSAGHSVHSMPSGRTSSLGLDTNFAIGGDDDHSPIDSPHPPPGLFILGSVPAIIRCWLTNDFSHNALLYGVICTGSRRSALSYSLVKDLGLVAQMQKGGNGSYNIRVPIYLPEAIISQPASRPNSPAPQLPTLTAEFEVSGLSQQANPEKKKGIHVFIGSDTLRAHNADILFSQNLMTIYGDDRVKLSVPFVRPEDENLFKNLCVSNMPPEKMELKATAPSFTPSGQQPKVEPSVDSVVALTEGLDDQERPNSADSDQYTASQSQPQSPPPISMPKTDAIGQQISSRPTTAIETSHVSKHSMAQTAEHETLENVTPSDPTRDQSSSTSGIWGSWRAKSTSLNGGSDNGHEPKARPSNYQRAVRAGPSRSMKVLKPFKAIPTATKPSPIAAPVARPSSTRIGSAYEPAPPLTKVPSRMSGESARWKATNGADAQASSNTEDVPPARWDAKRSSLDEVKRSRTSSSVQSSNPIGGASAFAWMNPAGKRMGMGSTAAGSAE